MTPKFLLLITLVLLSKNSISQDFENDIVLAAIDRTTHDVQYNGAYFSMAYPNGDVPAQIGVCTDVIIRS